MDTIKKYAKSVGAFVAVFIGNMILDLINGKVPFPTTKEEWVQYLVTSFGAALGAWSLRNKITEKQVEKAIAKGDVAPEVVQEIAVNTPPPPPKPVSTGRHAKDPDPVPVEEIQPSPSIVDQIISDAAEERDS